MKLNRTLPCGALLMLAVMLSSVSAFPQGGSAALSGRITDQAGLAVAGARVEAVNINTNATYSAETNESGLYNIPVIPPGSYRLSVSKEGFETIVQPNVDLHVADDIAINFALTVGSVTQSVTVRGDAVPLVNTTNSSLGGLVNDEKMADLPLNGRNYTDLTFMQPGVNVNSNASGTTSQGGVRGVQFTSDGASVRSNNITLDGANVLDIRGSSPTSESGTSLGVAGIKEYKIVTGPYDASYGLSSGAQVVMVSKSGTNQFHGEVFEYLRNDHLDAANYFDKPVAANDFQRLPVFQRNNFGGSFGGPIKKDKTFVFAAYEGLRQRFGQTIIDTVPGAGCHGAANTVITSTACPQLGVGAASVKIAPVMASILALYPIPNLPNNQFTFPTGSPNEVDWGQIRVDHNISASDSLFGRYTTDKTSLVSTTGGAGSASGTGFPEFAGSFASYDQFFTISENHIFSSVLLNQARFSYSRTHMLESQIYNVTPYTPDGVASVTGPGYSMVPGLPIGTISISGFTTFGPAANNPQYAIDNTYTLNDDLFYNKGKHALKFGLAINKDNVGQGLRKNVQGVPTFTSLANFLQGIASNYIAVQGGENADGDRNWMWWVPGFYAQDDWRILPRLTLNLGLRYEFMTTPYETAGKSYALVNRYSDAAFTQGPPFAGFSKTEFSPRVGFAWDVQGNGKTSVRGGFGQYYDLGGMATVLFDVKDNESPLDALLTHTGSTVITLPFTFFPGDTVGLSTADYYYKNPYVLKWNLTAERQLPASIGLQVAYVGSHGVHLYENIEGNLALPTAVVNGFPYWNGTEHRQNPNFSTSQLSTTEGQSTYNALQVAVIKRVTHGLEMQLSYTYSKELDLGQSLATDCSIASGMNYADYFAPGNSVFAKGPSCNDATHNVRANLLYHVPNIQSNNFLAKMEHGWWVGTIWSAQTGYPFSPVLGANRSQSQNFGGTNPDYPNKATAADAAACPVVSATCKYVPVPFNAGTVIEGTPTQWFNPNMFTMAPMVTAPGSGVVCTASTCGTGTTYGTLGNVARGLLRGPELDNVDFSINKDTHLPFLGEQGMLEFRAEMFNVLNHPNFNMPNGTVFAGTTTAFGPYSQAPSASAGVISSTVTTSRQIQLALKVSF